MSHLRVLFDPTLTGPSTPGSSAKRSCEMKSGLLPGQELRGEMAPLIGNVTALRFGNDEIAEEQEGRH